MSSTDRDPGSSGAPGAGTDPAPGAATGRAYPEVIEAYLEELGFLGVERRVLLFSHEIGVAEMDELDERMHAHLDGLSHAGDDAIDAIEERLESDDPWEVYAAARAWIDGVRPDLDTLTSRIEAAPEEVLPAWIEALRGVAEPVRAYPDSSAARAVLLASAPWSGAVDPGVVAACAGEPSAMLRRAAARAAVGTGGGAAHLVSSLCEDAAGPRQSRILATDRRRSPRRVVCHVSRVVPERRVPARRRVDRYPTQSLSGPAPRRSGESVGPVAMPRFAWGRSQQRARR